MANNIDTVLKVKYTGSSPSGNHPAVSVTGKRLGLHVHANSGTNAKAINGSIAGYTMPDPGSGSAGVLGAGEWGVMGKGDIGVSGEGGTIGVAGRSVVGIGVRGTAEGEGSWAGYFEGDVMVDGDFTETSDASLKQNVRSLTQGLEVVLALKPRAYEMKSTTTRAKPSSGTKFGLIAQEVQAVLPEIVKDVKAPPRRDADGASGEQELRFMSVKYTALIPVLIKAIQEQQAQIEALRAELGRTNAR